MKRKTDILKWLTAIIFFFCSSALFAQKRTIEGHVISQNDHKPLAGASITLEGSHIGTFTSPTGTFSIQAKPGDKIQVGYTGYVSKTIAIGDSSTILLCWKKVLVT